MNMSRLTFFAAGTPRAQGSKRAFVVGGRARLVEMAKGIKPWREVIRLEAINAMRRVMIHPFHGPVAVDLEFVMPRPKRPTKPDCDVKPDLDKLTRAALDAMSGAVFHDDSAVVSIVARKRFARPSGIESPGVAVTVSTAQRGVEIGERVPV